MPFDYYLSCLQNIKLQKNITSARGMTPALWLFIVNPHPNVGHEGPTEYSSHYENMDENRLGHQNKWLIYWSERLCYLFFSKSQERNLMADVLLLMPVSFATTITCTANLMSVSVVPAGQFIRFVYNRKRELLWHDKLSRYSKLHCTWYRSLLNIGKDLLPLELVLSNLFKWWRFLLIPVVLNSFRTVSSSW